jgi:diguanylate cyclase
MAQIVAIPKSTSLGEATLKAMVKHGIESTPQNYTVWYAYVSGLLPDLSRSIDTMIAEQRLFTEEVCTELYERFFDTSRQFGLLQQTSASFERAVDQVMRCINTAAQDTKDFNKTLGEASEGLTPGASEESVRAIVANLLVETQRAAERNQTLEARLERSSGEIVQLRQNLEVVRREALTDALTGIPNRKFFDTRLRECAAASMETSEPMSLLLLDIDYFKKFNDTYGHQVGDQVLRLVAKTLTECLKGRDTPARFGGEEFVIILPQTRLENAVTVAEQIRRTMARHKVVRKDTGADYGVIGISVGASLYRPGEPLQDLIKRADAALYHAKHTGRNRVVAEDDVPPEALAEAGAGAESQVEATSAAPAAQAS